MPCLSSGRILAGGVSGYASDDDGLTWEPLFLGYPGYGAAQVNRLHVTEAGTVIAAGEYFLAVSRDEDRFTLADGYGSYYAVASHGADVWAVGPGTLARSHDDGATWTLTTTGHDVELFDLATQDGARLIGVGARGAMLRSEDSGSTWSLVDTGLDRMLTVVRLDGDQAWVFGERGFLARFQP